MSSVVLSGDSSGSVTLTVPSAAGTNTATVPAQTGTLQMLGQGTSVATTSGTSVTFSSIPSWVKKVTVMLQGVSTSGTSNLLIQLGSGSVTSTGYSSNASTGGTVANSTAGMLMTGVLVAANNYSGIYTIATLGSNVWAASGVTANNTTTSTTALGGGSVTLSGTLDRVVITTVNGTDTFDAGSVNILYEG